MTTWKFKEYEEEIKGRPRKKVFSMEQSHYLRSYHLFNTIIWPICHLQTPSIRTGSKTMDKWLTPDTGEPRREKSTNPGSWESGSALSRVMGVIRCPGLIRKMTQWVSDASSLQEVKINNFHYIQFTKTKTRIKLLRLSHTNWLFWNLMRGKEVNIFLDISVRKLCVGEVFV